MEIDGQEIASPFYTYVTKYGGVTLKVFEHASDTASVSNTASPNNTRKGLPGDRALGTLIAPS